MKSYKIVSSTNPIFVVGMELPLDLEDLNIGDEVFFLGEKTICTQDKGAIMLNRPKNDDDLGAVYTLMEVPASAAPITKDKLEINKNIEIFFETKEIEVNIKCTYSELYSFLQQEWRLVAQAFGVSFPLEMRENNNLLLEDSWNIKNFENLSDGSFTRHDKNGIAI